MFSRGIETKKRDRGFRAELALADAAQKSVPSGALQARARFGGYGLSMAETLQVTIVYEQGEDGWVVASIPEVPGAHSQGRSREEARANVIDALHGILELRFGGPPGGDRGRRYGAARARHRRVKRRDLERHLRDHGARLLREGGNHSFWGFDAERSSAVPRHREIDFRLARKICADLDIPPPTGSR